ncbi:MAG: hypothetical protein B6U72_03990 [Candidatus Altiarchaeales archaeon ex4484_2]|nr:MAG: hypothetical protein B6U72_03990 [Candidatus Altiarchaeales archaeon ex4484_2]
MKCDNSVCIDVGCVGEGGTIPRAISPEYREHMAAECCEGLEAITYSGYFDENCGRVPLAGAPAGICSRCGNGVCDQWETKCNCPGDCIEEGCVEVGEEISPKEYSQGVRCCSRLKRINTGRYFFPCNTPGEYACDENGCSIPPPTSDEVPWWQCTPCGNKICESEYGENGCNCPGDCTEASGCEALTSTERDFCYQNKALNTSDASYCDKITATDPFVSKDTCYNLLAAKTKNKALCDKIQQPEIRRNCLENVQQ